MMTINLPELSGSEKQIAWATKIRSQLVESLDSEIARQKAVSTGNEENISIFFRPYVAALESIVSASAYIDRRADFVTFFTQLFADAQANGWMSVDPSTLAVTFKQI